MIYRIKKYDFKSRASASFATRESQIAFYPKSTDEKAS